MKNHLEKNDKKNIFLSLLIYSVVFIAAVFVIIFTFSKEGKTYIWMPDGEYIYYPFMVYTRYYIIGVAKTLLQTGKLIFPMWDFSIGQGGSVLTALRIDPFMIPFLLSPSRFLETAYAVTSFLRWYSAGVAFLLYCTVIRKTDTVPVTIGMLIYTFCGYALYAGTKHPYFVVYFLVYFPLLLAGAERYFIKRKKTLFIVTVFLMLAGNYYASFINTSLLAIYCLIREFAVYGKDLKKIISDIIRLIGVYVIGAGLSMAIFLPTTLGFLGSSRTGQYSETPPLVYTWPYYKSLFVNYGTPGVYGGWPQTTFIAISIPLIVTLFLKKVRYAKTLRFSWIMCTVFLTVPVFGKILNGFSYVSSRWCYGYAFCIGLIAVFVYPELKELSRRQFICVSLISMGYILLSMLMEGPGDIYVRTGIVLMILTLLLILLLRVYPAKKAGSILITAMCGICCIIVVYLYYSPDYGNEIVDYYAQPGISAYMEKSEEEVIDVLKDKSFYRTEVDPNRANRFLLADGNGTTAYWSSMPAPITDYYLDFELDSVRQSYALWGLDYRASLLTAASVKYIPVHASTERDNIPFGYKRKETVEYDDSKLVIYENEYALPLGYTYDSWIAEDKYESLTPLQKQQAILQSAVVDEAIEDLPEKEPVLTAVSVPYSIVKMKKIEQNDDGSFNVTKKNATIKLKFEGLEDCETYVFLKNLTYNGAKRDGAVEVSWKDVTRKTEVHRIGSLYDYEREGVSFNLGYSEKGKKTCTIKLERRGRYTLEPEIICLPAKDYERDASARGECVLENIVENGDEITGSINTDKTRLLMFTVPNYGGWTCYLDGQKTELLRVNTMYMGIVIEPGRHDIKLSYTIPGIKAGMGVSGVSLAACLVLIIDKIRKRKKK